MKSKNKIWLLKLLSISIGFFGAFLFFELIARTLPASDQLSLKLPLKCEDLKNPDIKCIFRRSSYKRGVYTRGKFPPFDYKAFKKTNDIGQFSDIDFKELVDADNRYLKIISIGDSYVEAIQVKNQEAFHGRLNKYISKENKKVISSSIGASGNAFPQYLIHLLFAKNNLDLTSSVLVIPIISNDFDESFKKYSENPGASFKSDKSGNLIFKEYVLNSSIIFRRILVSTSAIGRYLIFNLKLRSLIINPPICKLIGQKCLDSSKVKVNIIDSSPNKDIERYKDGEEASKLFINAIAKNRNSIEERNNTIFIISADRQHIYNKQIPKSLFFEHQRDYFITLAKQKGFKIIDLEEVFSENYKLNKRRFEFQYDNHWNSYAHNIVAEKIAEKLNLYK